MKATGVDSAGATATHWSSSGTAGAVAGVRIRSKNLDQPWIMANGSLEAIKWTALVLMVFDHINKFLYAETLPVVFQEGRIVMPMFGFVLAYNLARPGALASGMHGRMMYRLLLAGLAATPMCIVLNGGLVSGAAWWPLNILFTLLLVVALTYLVDRGGIVRYLAAAALFVIGGAFVEYLWMGVLCCLGAWFFLSAGNIQWAFAVVSRNALIDCGQWECLWLSRDPDRAPGRAPHIPPTTHEMGVLRILSGAFVAPCRHPLGMVSMMMSSTRTFDADGGTVA